MLRKTFEDDFEFFNWFNAVVTDGELRLSKKQIEMAEQNKGRLKAPDNAESVF